MQIWFGHPQAGNGNLMLNINLAAHKFLHTSWPQSCCHLYRCETQIWFGSQQSLRAGYGNLMLNIDLAAAAFITEQPALEFVYGDAARFPGAMSGQQLRNASKAITGLKVW